MVQTKQLRLREIRSPVLEKISEKGRTNWLSIHLEEFVRPVLGHIPEPSKSKYFTPEEMSLIKSFWRTTKELAKGKRILLPGRDVYIFEILARRENYPTVFIPQISRLTVSSFTEQFENKKEEFFILDTGFMGSIPRNLKIETFALVSHSRFRAVDTPQIYPRLTGSRALALKIEATPKYWNTARPIVSYPMSEPMSEPISPLDIRQKLSSLREFEAAAQLTMEIYRDSSPKFIVGPKPLKSLVKVRKKTYV